MQQFLISEVFSFLLIFCRLGSAIMLLPGFGEMYISARIRLLLALSISLAMTPLLSPGLPSIPAQPGMLFSLLGAEILIGIFFGAMARMLISAAHTTGTIIATQSGLANAMMLDVTQATQATVVSNLISFTTVVLLFVTDLHHVMLKGLIDSYTLFIPGEMPASEDLSRYAVETVSRAFIIAMQLSSPFIVIGILLYLAAGVIGRLMPNIQIFFLIMSPQITLAFYMLAVTIPIIMLYYMGYLEDALMQMVR